MDVDTTTLFPISQEGFSDVYLSGLQEFADAVGGDLEGLPQRYPPGWEISEAPARTHFRILGSLMA